ncbi:hypothetical protein MY888_09310, partial [Haemophilus influenzae]
AKITIETEINLPEMIKKAVEWIKGKVDWDAAKVSNTGDQSVAEVSGKQSIAVALGWQSKAKASINGAIVCVYRNHDGELIHIKASKVGENNIKADTWYTLDEIGEFVEVKDD